jgi:hypothetical protein
MNRLRAFRGILSMLFVFGCLYVGVVEMVLGQAAGPCCKSCERHQSTVAECRHTTFTPPIPCEKTKCTINVIDQNACAAGGTRRDCKTKADPANKVEVYQTRYTGIVDCPFGTDNGITVIERWFFTSLDDGENCAIYRRVRVSCRGTLTVAVCTAGTKDPDYTDVPRGGPRHLCD